MLTADMYGIELNSRLFNDALGIEKIRTLYTLVHEKGLYAALILREYQAPGAGSLRL